MSQPTFPEQMQAIYDHFTKVAPDDVKTAIDNSLIEIKTAFQHQDAIQAGTALPLFQLPDATGNTVSSTGLLAQGPLLITFYRGEWCPFCNVALSGLQKHAEAFRAKGVTLVAISPELPNTSLTTVEKNALQFPVLSDVRNEYARKLGIVWEMPVYLKPIFKNFGTDLETRNGDGHFEVPVPATILVDKNGIVKNTYIDPDYTKRLDPEVALTWTNDL